VTRVTYFERQQLPVTILFVAIQLIIQIYT